MSTRQPIPAILRIDVEPDQHQPAVGGGSWDGFVETAALIDRLRDRLADRSGCAARFTWLLRMDPDIERSFGRPDFVVHRYADTFDRLTAQGDALGIHVHHYRWNAQKSVTFSDYADTAWTQHCFAVACDAFRAAFGERVRIASQGGYFMSEAIVDAAVGRSIEVDLTVEPGLAPIAADPSFGTYTTAPSPDFARCPRRPYYPSREAFDVPSTSPLNARPLLMIPLTAYDYQTALRPWYREIAHRLLNRPNPHLPLSPWKRWPSPKIYWDLVERAADEQPARYFACAMRTDDPASGKHQTVRDLLEYLPEHPIAERLRFVDPRASEIQALAAA